MTRCVPDGFEVYEADQDSAHVDGPRIDPNDDPYNMG
jgi:hypothetical protein